MTSHTLYTKDKNVRVSFRLDGKLSEWILKRSECLGVTPSAFLRNLAYQNFYTETVLERIGTADPVSCHDHLNRAVTEQSRKVAQNADNETLQHD